MKHLKNSLVVFAIALVVMGVVTSFIPSLTKGQKSADVPKSAFSVTTNPSEGDFNTVVSGPDPAGTSYAITSLTVTNLGISSELVILQGIWGNTSDCLSFPQLVEFSNGPFISAQAGQTIHLSFPQPVVHSARSGAVSCLRISSSGHPSLHFTVVGYRF